MSPSSLTPLERARKNYSVVLKALSSAGQAPVARAMGVSEGHVSKIKSERLEELCELLGHCGLKVVPTHFKCYPQQYVDSLHYLAHRGMQLPPPDDVDDEVGLY